MTDLSNMHVLVTGGGGGIGLALLRKLVPLGTHVSFVTKDLVKAQGIIAELKRLRKNTEQRVVAVSADLSEYEQSQTALEDAIKAQDGLVPSWVFLGAGFAPPGVFWNFAAEDLQKAMDGLYLVQAWITLAAVKAMKEKSVPGNIVFISSFHSSKSYAGYSAIAPARFAIKGLHETLRAELAPLNISTHLFEVNGSFGSSFDHEYGMKSNETQALDAMNGYVKLDENVEAEKILDRLFSSRNVEDSMKNLKI